MNTNLNAKVEVEEPIRVLFEILPLSMKIFPTWVLWRPYVYLLDLGHL